MNLEQSELCVYLSVKVNARYWGNLQYAAKAPCMFTTKLSKDLCLECSTCAIFISPLLTVSIIARFWRSSLSDTLINAPFMLLCKH